jgi:hypothetical protein
MTTRRNAPRRRVTMTLEAFAPGERPGKFRGAWLLTKQSWRVLMLVSIGPLSFYGWQVIELNREKLERTEKLSQLSIAKSLAREIAQYLNGYREQILGFASVVELRGSISGIEDSSTNHLLQKKLEALVTRSKNLLYINIVNSQGKGVRAGRYNAEDPLVQHFFTRAFLEGSKDQSYISEPLALEVGNQFEPVIIMSTPIFSITKLQ